MKVLDYFKKEVNINEASIQLLKAMSHTKLDGHSRIIKMAIEEGKEIPLDVKKDYPDLFNLDISEKNL